MMHSSTKFMKYYLEYYEKIYRYIFFRSYQDEELAKDLTSETFLKAFEKFDTYDPEKGFSAWIYAVARNCVIDHFRKHKRGKETDLEDAEYVPASENITEDLDQDLQQQKLLQYVEELPENAREMILLKYFNQYDNQEIAEMLDLNPATMRTQLHRAMKMLREKVPETLLTFLIFVLF